MEKCQDHDDMKKKIDEIHSALIGTYEKKGLISKVSDNTNFTRNAKRAIWIVYSAVIGIIIKMAFWK